MRKVIELFKSGLHMLLYILLGFLLLGQLSLNAAEAVENQKVRVGYFYLPGYHEMDASGRLYGYGYDLLQKLQLYNDWSCEYIGYNEKWMMASRCWSGVRLTLSPVCASAASA